MTLAQIKKKVARAGIARCGRIPILLRDKLIDSGYAVSITLDNDDKIVTVITPVPICPINQFPTPPQKAASKTA